MKKIAKSFTARSFQIYNPDMSARGPDSWTFAGQGSIRTTTSFKDKNPKNLYRMCPGWGLNTNAYRANVYYPGQKVWVLRQNKKTGQISVDSDRVSEISFFGQLGKGSLRDIWLVSYGIGHGLEPCDIFPNRQAAEAALRRSISDYSLEEIY